MGGSSTTTQATLAPELRPLFSGSVARMLGLQQASPVTDFLGRNAQQTAPLSQSEREGISLQRGLQKPSGLSALTLQQILRMPQLAAAGPGTGVVNNQGIPDMATFLRALQNPTPAPAGSPVYLDPGSDPGSGGVDPGGRPGPGPGGGGDPGDPIRERLPLGIQQGVGADYPTSSGGPRGRTRFLGPPVQGPDPAAAAAAYQPPASGDLRNTTVPNRDGSFTRYDSLGRSTIISASGQPQTAEGSRGSIGSNHTPSVFRNGQWVTDANDPQGYLDALNPNAGGTPGGGGVVPGGGGIVPPTGRTGGGRVIGPRGAQPASNGLPTDLRLREALGIGQGVPAGGPSASSPGDSNIVQRMPPVTLPPRPAPTTIPPRTGGETTTGGGGTTTGGIPGWDLPGMWPPGPTGEGTPDRMPPIHNTLPPRPPPRTIPPRTGGETDTAPPEGPDATALNALQQFSVQPNSPDTNYAYLDQSPTIKAAMAAFNAQALPTLQNQANLSGLGRSTAATNAIANAQGQMMTPLLQDELARQERSAVRTSEATQQQIQDLLQLTGAEQGRQEQAVTGLMQTGGVQRGVGQSQLDAQFQDYLRRQGLSEEGTMLPLGQGMPSAFGSQVNSSGGLFK
jgi:hypothetical protein